MNTETINNYDENGFLISKSRFNEHLMIYHEIFNKNNITIYKIEIINDDKFEYIDHSEYKNNNTKENKNIKCNYKNGKLHGKYISMYSHCYISSMSNNFRNKHLIKIECNYENGELHEEYKEYNCNGELILECNYKNGELDGIYTQYSNNEIKMQCNYKNNKLNGEYREYESYNNFIKIHCNYKNNKLDGDYKEYKCNKLIYHCIYKKNIIINEILNNKILETCNVI